MDNFILGVDPGLGGCICRLNISTLVPEFFDMPITTYKKIVKSKNDTKVTRRYRRIDKEGVYQLCRELVTPAVSLIVLELQSPHPRQGTASGAKIAHIFGLLQGILMSFPVKTVEIRPPAWKRDLQLITKKDKPATYYQRKKKAWHLAARLFPEHLPQLLPMTSSFDKAESLLLAYWGLQFYIENRRSAA